MAAFLTLLGTLAALLVPATQAHAATVTFTTGAARTDQNRNPLQLHGLGIIKVGDTWYGFGEDKTGKTSADTSFENIPLLHLDRPRQLDPSGSGPEQAEQRRPGPQPDRGAAEGHPQRVDQHVRDVHAHRQPLDLTGSYTGSNYMLVNIGSGLHIGVAGSTAQGAAVDQELGASASVNSETWTLS
ncbi:hypothetical protein [Streptomyces sp. AC550_RSS872]|uniref:hypothetical protein n=1 Tax=Streptomyces sp. AC550_RSS872 TaxID=2823689 RepID=UPI0020B7AD5B|nr:hypothetical protein [Streptomyces sp. AC550_RSS872]